MIRILRIVNRFNLGGPTFNAAYLTKYLSPEFETLLIGGIHEDQEESSEYILNSLGIHATVLPEIRRSINGISDVHAYLKIKKIIKDFKPHIVHTHASKAGMVGRKAAFDMNVPVIVHTFHGHVFHSYFNALKTKTFIHIERQLAKKTDKIIAVSPSQKEELSKTYRIAEEEKFEVIPLGIDLTRFLENQEEKRYIFRKDHHLDDDEIAIGIIGRLVPVKNHQLFIKAIAQVKQNSNKKIRAFIVGDGETRYILEALAHQYNLSISPNGYFTHKPDIWFTSWIKQIDYVYAGLDIVALTSLNEGTPVSLIEAQAAGKPVVSTNVGGIKDIVIENKTALLSDPKDERTFINNMMLLVNNVDLRKKLSHAGKDLMLTKHHYINLVRNTRELYNKLLMQKNIITKATTFV